MPRVFECAIAERARMQLPPAPAQEQPIDRPEAVTAGLALAEKLNLGSYLVFRDEARPGGNEFKGTPVVWGHAGVQGREVPPTFWPLHSFAWRHRQFRRPRRRRILLLTSSGSAESSSAICLPYQAGQTPSECGREEKNAYEEWYLVRRTAGGYYQLRP